MHDITLTQDQVLDAAMLFVDAIKDGFATDKDGNVPLLKAAPSVTVEKGIPLLEAGDRIRGIDLHGSAHCRSCFFLTPRQRE